MSWHTASCIHSLKRSNEMNRRRNHNRRKLSVGFIVTVALFYHRDSYLMCDANRRRQPFKRKIYSLLIHHRSQFESMKQRRNRSTDNDSRSTRRGSFMTNQKPNKERLFRWFGIKGDDPNQCMRSMMLQNEFNHNVCGITNPLIRINAKMSRQHQQQLDEYCQNDIVTQGDDKDPNSTERSWWPSLQVLSDKKMWNKKEKISTKWNGKNSNFVNKEEWRILVYRKIAGKGKKCYQQVRDAALDWEFQSADGSLGMMEIPIYQSRNGMIKSPKRPNTFPTPSRYSVQPIIDESDLGSYSASSSLYRSLGSRRLVSFSSQSITRFLPPSLQQRIYAINPVMVVYDVIDQRAPQTLFTSTAYSTLKGHFLRGEERVTVVLRDGSQQVEIELLSISRAGNSLSGKTLWPLIGKMQDNFFRQQLEHLAKSGSEDICDRRTTTIVK